MEKALPAEEVLVPVPAQIKQYFVYAVLIACGATLWNALATYQTGAIGALVHDHTGEQWAAHGPYIGALLAGLPLLIMLAALQAGVAWRLLGRNVSQCVPLYALGLVGVMMAYVSNSGLRGDHSGAVLTAFCQFVVFVLYDMWFMDLFRPANPAFQEGTQFPDISLHTVKGQQVSLQQLLHDSDYALLVFYQGAWSPTCRAQIKELQSFERQFAASRIKVVLISADEDKAISQLAAVSSPSFLFLRDHHLSLGTKLDLVHEYGVPHHHRLFAPQSLSAHCLYPTVAVVDKQHTVKFADLSQDGRSRIHPQVLLDALLRPPPPAPASA